MRRRREEEGEAGEGSDVSCCCCWCCRYSAAAWRSSSCHSPFPRSSCLVLITFFELQTLSSQLLQRQMQPQGCLPRVRVFPVAQWLSVSVCVQACVQLFKYSYMYVRM